MAANLHSTWFKKKQFGCTIFDKDQSYLCSSYCVSPAEFLDVSSNIFSSFISLMSHSQKCCKSLKSVCSDFLLKKKLFNVNNLKSKTFIRLQAYLYLSWSPLVSQSFCFKILVITQLFWTCGVELIPCDCLEPTEQEQLMN